MTSVQLAERKLDQQHRLKLRGEPATWRGVSQNGGQHSCDVAGHWGQAGRLPEDGLPGAGGGPARVGEGGAARADDEVPGVGDDR